MVCNEITMHSSYNTFFYNALPYLHIIYICIFPSRSLTPVQTRKIKIIQSKSYQILHWKNYLLIHYFFVKKYASRVVLLQNKNEDLSDDIH